MAALAMPRISRRRSNTSVDQLFELVDGLDDSQIHSLLEDFNNTVDSNVQVSHAIDMFEHPKPKPHAPRPPSIRRSSFIPPRLPLPVRPLPYLTRSKSKRQSTTPEPISRPRTALPMTPKHYRRISRPVLPSPASGPELNALLSAYLSPAPAPPPSTPSTLSLSPLSPRSFSSSSTMSFEAEDVGMDSLAPLVFGRPQRETSDMSDIFEVLEF